MHESKEAKALHNRLKLGITINFGFTLIEFAIGFFSGSLALISDACQNLTDVASLIISMFANKISQKKPTAKKTFGYGRVTILAALLNGSILMLISIYIFKESYFRFFNPEPVESSLVMITGLTGILVNGGVASMFFKYRKNLNIKAALVNMVFDTIASAGALIAGIIIMFTGKTFVDPLISIIISVMLLITAFKILKEVIHLLLEGVPHNINLKEIAQTIKNMPEIIAIDDLHVWAISSEYSALSCHIVIDKDKLPESVSIIKKVREKLEPFQIKHSTIEINYAKCVNSICRFTDDI